MLKPRISFLLDCLWNKKRNLANSGGERWKGIWQTDCKSIPHSLFQPLVMPFLNKILQPPSFRASFSSPWSWAGFVTWVGLKNVVEMLCISSKPRPQGALYASMKACHSHKASLLKAPRSCRTELSHPSQGHLDQPPASRLANTWVNSSQDLKNSQIKSAKICRSAQLICRPVSRKKCLLQATELLWLFNTQYYCGNR